MGAFLRFFAAFVVLLAAEQVASARGFGGGGGGGFHGAGGFSGGYHAGGLGGYHAGEPGAFGRGGYGYGAGAFRGPEAGRAYGYAPYRGLSGGAVSSHELNRFLGLPTDAGLHAAGIEGAGGLPAARGLEGRAATTAGAFRRLSPAENRALGWDVRRDFGGYGWFGSGWYTAHPGYWRPAAWYRAGVTAGAWGWASWPLLGGWFGYAGAAPYYYNYGDNVVYDGGNVYYDGQMTASADEYYDQASALAGVGATAAPDDKNWLSLGVFSFVKTGEQQPSLVFQLAVNKAGVIRGNCLKPDQQFVGVVQGAVDKETQRVAWTVGNDQKTVYETGLYNLTQDEAPALVHDGKEKSDQWLMVRIKQSDGPTPTLQTIENN